MKTAVYRLIMLLSICLAMSPNAQAQLLFNKKTPTVKTSKVTNLKFSADDPIGNLKLSTVGTPWEDVDYQPIEMPEGVVAEIPDPLPELKELTSLQYNAAVSMAFEMLRVLYGEMSKKDAETFDAMWAPLFDCPSQELIDYFNKLNPLLSQFMAARESYFRTAADVQLLYMDAAEAVAEDEQGAFESILSESKILVTCMKSLEAAMAELANKIQLLGNPPNPFIAKAEARRRYNSAFSPKKEIYVGECWMGTRESGMYAEGLPPLTEAMFRYLFKAKVNGNDKYFVIELAEDGIPDEEERNDELAAIEYIDVVQYDCNNVGSERPDFTSDGKFQTYFPKPPVMAISSLTMTYLMLKETSEQKDEDYFNAVCNYGNRVLRAGPFFKTAIEWSADNKWDEYTYYENGVVPSEALHDFTEALKAEIRQEIADQAKSAKERRAAAAKAREEAAAQPLSPEALKQKAVKDSLEKDRKDKEESIAQREELIRELRRQISEERRRISEASGPGRADLIDQCNRRITGLEAEISNEEDNIRCLQTGEFHHTRTVWEALEHEKGIQKMKVEAARRDATKRYAEGMEKQIERLPTYVEREEARERLDKLLYEDGALVSGDVEKARKLALHFQNQHLANELKVQAKAEEEIAYADIKEAAANAVVMTCGSLTVGFAAEAFAGTFGTGSAMATFGPKMVGAIYGGTTGYIQGGAAKSVCSAAGYIHPVTQAMASFYEGFADESNAGKTTTEKIWEGAKKAGTDYIIGKGMELGATAIAKTCAAFMNNGTAKFTFKEKLDMMRTQRQRLEARDAVKTFAKANGEYQTLLNSGTATPAQISAAKANRDKLAAVLNADYHAKWHMKYKASDELKGAFNEGVQANYDKMMPKMKTELEAKGFNMDDIDFKQFRNSSSAGSSSMDLDLGAVSKTTGNEPAFIRNGKSVSAAEFMEEAQKTMNSVYRQQTGMSAKASEMNFTTSAHPEAYNTAELLKGKSCDFYSLTTKDVASVGRVIDVKMDAIENNINMTATTKLQAKSREATKEISNMLLPKMRQDLAHTNDPNKMKEISKNITYWEDMQKMLSDMGKKTNNPLDILKINNNIKNATGGKDATQVVNELAREFDAKF